MFLNTLQRAIFLELFKVFILSLLGITGIVVLGGVVAEASQRGLSPVQILMSIPLIVPSLMPFTIPATTLFATCVVYGRLAHDNEVTALKAAGVNPLRVLAPGIFLGLLASAVTMGLYYDLIPRTHHLMRTLFLNDVKEALYAFLKKDGQIKMPKTNYVIFVRGVQGYRLKEAVFKETDASGRYKHIAWARDAELDVDLVKREVRVTMRHGVVLRPPEASAYFRSQVWEVPLPQNDAHENRRARALTWPEIVEKRRHLAGDAARLAEEAARLQAPPDSGQHPPEWAQHVRNLEEMRRQRGVDIRLLDAELHMRPALALGCLCFVLVGCPVGIWFSRSDYLSAFITCFLPIIFLYYPLLLCGQNLAKDGRLDTALGLWTANALMALIALAMFRRLLKN